MTYTIERTDKEILIKLPLDTTPKAIQGVLNYFRYLELGKGVEIDQTEIDKMAQEAKSGWWEKNKHRFSDIKGFENLDK